MRACAMQDKHIPEPLFGGCLCIDIHRSVNRLKRGCVQSTTLGSVCPVCPGTVRPFFCLSDIQISRPWPSRTVPSLGPTQELQRLKPLRLSTAPTSLWAASPDSGGRPWRTLVVGLTWPSSLAWRESGSRDGGHGDERAGKLI